MTLISYKYRLYPNKEQQEYFAKVFGCVRFVYNKMLEDSEKYYQIERKRLKTNPSSYKDEFPFLREVDSSALSNAKMSLDHAYDRFFKKEANRPRFKSKKDQFCSYSTNFLSNNIRVEGSYIRLPKIKFVKFRMHRPFNGAIKKATVTKTPSGEFFVILLVDTEVKKPPIIDKKIGIDIGIVNYLTGSDGTVVKNVRSYNDHMRKLARENRRLSRKMKGGKNREKQRIRLAKVYRKITNVRNDFQHKLSRKIVNENQVIACEKLVIDDMMKINPFAKRDIMDSAWSTFIRFLKYKSEWYGRQFIQVDTFFPSSQICCKCGHQNQDIKGINKKVWTCPECGAIHQRDVNAGMNILKEGERLLALSNGEGDFTKDHSSGVFYIDIAVY